MPRLSRAVTPGYAHHVIQRGNRRQQTFFTDDDYRAYIILMNDWCKRRGVEIWAYCLMPNHVHLIAVPESEESLRRAIGEAHRRYTRRINFREDWRGHLWQGRFSSYIMDHYHLLTATRYIEINPVRAGLVEQPEQRRWSSAASHLAARDDALVKTAPLLEMVRENWRDFLAIPTEQHTIETIRLHERTGRPLGNDSFVAQLEDLLGRTLTPGKQGRPKKDIE
jgi:putative transposase